MSTRTVKVSATAFLDTRHVVYLASDDALTQLSIQYDQVEGAALPVVGDEFTLDLSPVVAPAPAEPAPPAVTEPEPVQGSGNL